MQRRQQRYAGAVWGRRALVGRYRVGHLHDGLLGRGLGGTGRVRLTTLTKETFIPGFLERDEGERELPYAKYPWDGISGVRPFRELAATTTVGVY